MDFVASTTETAIPLILDPTLAAFAPILEKNRGKIESIKRVTHQYGDTERQQLDIYSPPSSSSANPPVLFFVYGGGFFSGERAFPPPRDLWHKNVGAFFASRGIVTVIPDYRLVAPGSDTSAVFPDPVSDVSKAIQFFVQHHGSGADLNNIFIAGHSAGANIAATLLLYTSPSTAIPPSIRKSIKGLILCGGAFHFNYAPILPPPILASYYGTAEPDAIHKSTPCGLLEKATNDVVKALPSALFIVAEKDVPEVIKGNEDFVKLWNETTGSKNEIYIAKGHNHISLFVGLSSDEGEEFGEEITRFITNGA